MFNQFRCLCDGAWGGPKCTSYDSVNDCATSPCKNGATCNDQYQGVTCECSQGWGGPSSPRTLKVAPWPASLARFQHAFLYEASHASLYRCGESTKSLRAARTPQPEERGLMINLT